MVFLWHNLKNSFWGTNMTIACPITKGVTSGITKCVTHTNVTSGDVTAPTITSSASPSVDENQAFSHTLTADEAVTWSIIGGADQALFSLAGNTLSMTAKDYEAPADADTNNVYQVQVRATDGSSNTTDQTINVTVNDVLDPGLLAFTVKTNNAGTSGPTQFTVPTYSAASYNCTVYWGDGTSSVITTYNDAAWTHTYPSAGTYQITIDGDFGAFRFNNGGDKLKLLSIDQWGSTVFDYFDRSFWGCSNMNILATDSPTFSLVNNSLAYAFVGCSSLTGGVSGFNTAGVTNIYQCFYLCTLFNDDLSGWNAASVAGGAGAQFLQGSAFSNANYDALLLSWSAQSLQTGVTCHFGTAKYTEVAARAILTGTYSWTITDGGAA